MLCPVCVCVCGKSMQWSWIMQLSQSNRVMQCNGVFNSYMYMYMHFCTLISVKSNSKLTHLGLLLGTSALLRQQKWRCVWSCTEHSSVHITLSKSSLMCFLAHSNRFTLLGSRISWQYELPRNVQPRDVQQRSIVLSDNEYPRLHSSWCSWWAVVSSLHHICSSTNTFTSLVNFKGLPEPDRWPIDPVSLYFARNFAMPLLLATIPSSSLSKLAMVGLL